MAAADRYGHANTGSGALRSLFLSRGPGSGKCENCSLCSYPAAEPPGDREQAGPQDLAVYPGQSEPLLGPPTRLCRESLETLRSENVFLMMLKNVSRGHVNPCPHRTTGTARHSIGGQLWQGPGGMTLRDRLSRAAQGLSCLLPARLTPRSHSEHSFLPPEQATKGESRGKCHTSSISSFLAQSSLGLPGAPDPQGHGHRHRGGTTRPPSLLEPGPQPGVQDQTPTPSPRKCRHAQRAAPAACSLPCKGLADVEPRATALRRGTELLCPPRWPARITTPRTGKEDLSVT